MRFEWTNKEYLAIDLGRARRHSRLRVKQWEEEDKLVVLVRHKRGAIKYLIPIVPRGWEDL